MMAYDNSYDPPKWWREKLDAVQLRHGWTDGEVIAMAREADGREPKWDASRLSKFRNGRTKATIQLVMAISKAIKIPSPIVEANSEQEAEDLDRWWTTRRASSAGTKQSGKPPRAHTVAQALDAAVKEKKDQTEGVPSPDEGIAGSRRARRAPRSRS